MLSGNRCTTIVWIVFGLAVASNCINYGEVPCKLRQFPDGLVCVCNATYCDRPPSNLTDNADRNSVTVVSSSMAGHRFSVTHIHFNARNSSKGNKMLAEAEVRDPNEGESDNVSRDESTPSLFELFLGNAPIKATVTVNRNKRFQKIVGFGGAFTGTVSHLLQQLPELESAIGESYYSSEHGIGFNMMRIPIGGCDFDLAPWAYNEAPVGDKNLTNFTRLDQRDLDRIGQIKNIPNWDKIKYVGAAWSPPPWMKTNNEWTGFSSLWPHYYRTWANYHLRYVELMNEADIRFWAISTGNEPLNGIIGWVFVHFMSLGWTAATQGQWVGDHLGPVFRQSQFSDVKLLGSDDQRYVFPWWFDQMKAAHPESVNYLDGFAVHWYWDKLAPPVLLDRTRAKYPNKLILNTESCIGDKPWQKHGPVLGSWARAEDYITSYFQSLQHSVNGWIDWNLILDEQGGPNYTNNTVDAPIIVNQAAKEFYKQPIFYAIGHFSRFVPADSQRIEVTSTNSHVLAIGFESPASKVSIVLYNKSQQTAEIVIVIDDKRKIALNVLAKSIHTVVYNL